MLSIEEYSSIDLIVGMPIAMAFMRGSLIGPPNGVTLIESSTFYGKYVRTASLDDVRRLRYDM